MATDPYAAPRARVADLPAAGTDGEFLGGARAVAAGNGWRWLADGWKMFRRQPGTWILLIVAFAAISIAIAIIPVLGNIGGYVLGPVFAGGLMLGCRELARGGDLRIGHLFDGFRARFGPLALLGVAYFVIVLVAVLVAMAVTGAGAAIGVLFGMAGSEAAAHIGTMTILLAALVAAGLLVPVGMAIWFAPALVVLNGFGVADALKTSFAACLRNIVPFLVYGVIFLGLAIVASVPFMLGWLAFGPVVVASVYTAYRDLFYAD